MQALITSLKSSNLVLFPIIYLSFFLDNVLLTVVVPIIPDYLFSIDQKDLKSLSPLQQKFEHLENDNGPLGALLASKAFVQLTFTPIVGYLIETLGCNIPLLLGSCNMLLASILFAYGNSYGLLVLARALHGTSSASIAVSGMTILAKNVPKTLRSRLMPLAFGGIALGVLIGYPLGGAAYQLLGKPAPFLFIAFLVTLNIIFQIAFLEDEDTDVVEVDNTCHWLELVKDSQIIIATIAICITTSSMSILEPCVPIWLMGHLSPPPSRWQLGAVFIPDSVGYFIGSHFAGLLPVDSWRIALSAMVLAGLSCCGLPLVSTLSQLSIPHFGLGLSVGTVDAALVPLLASLVDKKGGPYGPIYALQQVSVSLAYAFGPLLGGQGVHFIGFSWAIRIVGFLNLMFCPFLLELESVKPSRTNSKDFHSYSSLEETVSASSDVWK